MATVYRAYDTRLDREVAVKFIRAGQLKDEAAAEMLARFRREAQTLSRLSHPNILPVYDYGEHEGELYLVTAFMPGGTLQQKLGQAVPVSEASRLLVPIARALEFAHSLNIIHRDVKPSNILLSPSGLPVLADFGIAKILEAEHDTRLTGTGVGIGTPAYMAPEQATGQGVDHRADIYALGIVLYELLTGRLPFVADTPIAVLLKHANEPLPRPRNFVRDLPDQAERVLFRALAKRPEHRYASMGGFAADLEGLALAASRPARPQDRPGLRAALLSLGGLSLLALAGICVAAVWAAAKVVRPAGPVTSATPAPSATIMPATATPAPTEAAAVVLPSATVPASGTPVLDGGKGLIAFYSARGGSNDLYVMQWNGSEVRRITISQADERVPAWSPNGRQLAYYSNADGDYELFVLDIATGEARQVTHNACGDFAPQWSPDGRKLIYYADCDGNREIYALNADGSSAQQLTFTTDVYNWFPTWSPDGAQIVFASNRTGSYQIYAMEIDGSSLQALTEGCIPAFSPDGQWLALATRCDGGGDILLLPAAGGAARNLTDSPAGDANPAWSRDGQLIVYQSGIGNNRDIFVMDRDGQLIRQLTSDPADDAAPVWQP